MPKIVFSRTLDDVDWHTRVVSENVAYRRAGERDR
jgi:hypothetical protein